MKTRGNRIGNRQGARKSKIRGGSRQSAVEKTTPYTLILWKSSATSCKARRPSLYDHPPQSVRALGAGLLVLALLPDADAQEAGRRGGGRGGRFGGAGPSDIGAWLHFSRKRTGPPTPARRK